MKKISVLFLIILFAMVSCSKKDGQDNVLVMGTNAAFPPFEFIGGKTGDEVIGFDVEIAKAIAKKKGVELKIEDMEFDTLLTALNGDKVDFVIAGMTINETRAKSVDFSNAYYEATQAVIVQKDNTSIVSNEDLKNKKVAVQLGTTGNGVAEEYSSDITAFNTGFEAIMELKSGRVDLVIIDEQPAQAYVAKNPDLKIVPMSFDPEYYGIAVKKGNPELVSLINSVLDELKSSGKYDELILEYMK